MRTAHTSRPVQLDDFTARARMLAITALALVVGGAGALAALAASCCSG